MQGTRAHSAVASFAALLLILSIVTTTTGRAHHTRRRNKNVIDNDCEKLAYALSRVYKEVIVPVYDASKVLSEIKMVVGINPEDERQVTKFACDLKGTRSLQELSRHFRLPYTLSRQLYGELMDELSMCGGVEGCKVYMRMMTDLSVWVHQIHYTEWPLHTTYAHTSKFLRKMAAEYGADFLSSPVLLDKSSSSSPILVTEDNIDSLALGFVNAGNFSDLARLTGYPQKELTGLDAGLRMLAQSGSYVISSNAALEQLIDAADNMELLYLPNQ